jgi:hypothetical protein
MIVVGKTALDRDVARLVGRAMLLGATFESCPAIMAAVAQRLQEAMGICYYETLSLKYDLRQYEEVLSEFLVQAIESVLEYDRETALEIKACAEQVFAKKELRLPLSLNRAGRYS